MNQLWAIGVKYVGVTAAVFLGSFVAGLNVGYAQVLISAAFLTFVAYLVGDLLILPAGGNLVAVVADMGLAAGTLWVESTISAVIVATPLFLVVTTLSIGVFEYVFHAYLLEWGLVESRV